MGQIQGKGLKLAALILVIAFIIGLMPVAALSQNITYDGTNTALLQTDPIWGGSEALFPSDPGAFSGNTITVSGTLDNWVYGGVSANADAVMNNAVFINGCTTGTVYGGYSVGGAVSGNSVTVNDGLPYRLVVGGFSNNSAITGNTVIFNGGVITDALEEGSANGGMSLNSGNSNPVTGNTVTIARGTMGYARGASTYGTGSVSGNTAIVTGGTVRFGVSGGSGSGDVVDNSVIISGGTVGNTISSSVTGGASSGDSSNRVTGNSVSISGDAVVYYRILGGFSENGSATGNDVTISGSPTIDGMIYGGVANTGDVTGNTITISGSPTIGGSIYGGQASSGNVTGNTITIGGNPSINGLRISGGITGGMAVVGGLVTDNTLNVNTFDLYPQTVEKFSTLNFTLPSNIANGDTVFNVYGTINAVTLTGVTVNLALDSPAPVLAINDEITLISNVTGTFTPKTVVIGEYTFVLSVTGGNALVATVTTAPSTGVAPTITTASLPNGTVGTAYSATLSATGDATIIWALDTGSALPAGLSLSGSGMISGTPTASGTFNFVIKATNSAGNATKALSITINSATPTTHTITASARTGGSISPSGNVSVNSGANQTFTVTANNGYYISSVTVDGINQGAVSTYTFTSVSSDHMIDATFGLSNTDGGSISSGSGGGYSPSNNASLSQNNVSYYLNGGQDITITLNTGSYILQNVKNGSYILVKSTDYIVSGNQITIKASYLATLDAGKHSILFGMSGGVNPMLTISIVDNPAKTVWQPMKPTYPAGTEVAGTVSTNTLVLNGKESSFPAANIEDYNWLKLRDIATLLNGTSKQFSVEYDSETNTIIIEPEKPYTPIGDELQNLLAGNLNAVASSQKIIFDGKEISVAAYNINGYNYFRLRDLAILLNFMVSYDNGTVTLDLESPYSE